MTARTSTKDRPPIQLRLGIVQRDFAQTIAAGAAAKMENWRCVLHFPRWLQEREGDPNRFLDIRKMSLLEQLPKLRYIRHRKQPSQNPVTRRNLTDKSVAWTVQGHGRKIKAEHAVSNDRPSAQFKTLATVVSPCRPSFVFVAEPTATRSV